MMAQVQTESHRYFLCNRVHPVSSIPWKVLSNHVFRRDLIGGAVEGDVFDGR